MQLRASFIIDYQNVHLTARDVFLPGQDPHTSLIHPVRFANVAIRARNSRQRQGYPHAVVTRVLVYRGLPHVDHDPEQNRRCLAQRADWASAGAEVTLRDLKYRHQYGADGRPVQDIHGHKIVIGKGQEKGIDVLVALACVREARRPDIDVVVLASRDTDLVPVLDEVTDMHSADRAGVAQIETVSWHEPGGERNFGSLRPSAPRRIWNTNLDRGCFEASLDRTDYT